MPAKSKPIAKPKTRRPKTAATKAAKSTKAKPLAVKSDAKATKTRLPPCCRRKFQGGETYRYFSCNFVFDVEVANKLVADGRDPVELDDQSTRKSVEMSHICKPHVAHVDSTRPGIIAHVQCEADDGEVIKAHVLIDGNHRAARCLQLNRPFTAFLLTEEESQSILLRKPNHAFAKVESLLSTPAKSKTRRTPRKKVTSKK
jgi:hypothetical protein